VKEQHIVRQSVMGPTPVKLLKFEELSAQIGEIRCATERHAVASSDRARRWNLEDWIQAEFKFLHPAPCEVTASNGAITVRAEVSDFSAEDLKVSVEPSRVAIVGKKQPAKERGDEAKRSAEFRPRRLLRVLALPAEVDPAKAQAVVKNGILEVIMPKVAATPKVERKSRAA